MIFETAQEMKDRRLREADNRVDILKKIEGRGRCEGVQGPCEATSGLSWATPRNAYKWDVDKDPIRDPNGDMFLCESCAGWMKEYWDEMWGEYYSGCM